MPPPPPPPPPPSGSVMSGDERAERRAADLHIPRLMCKEAPQVGGGGGGQPWRAPPWRFRTRGSSPRGSNPSWWSVKPAGCSSGSPQRAGSEPRATEEHCALMENRTITAPLARIPPHNVDGKNNRPRPPARNHSQKTPEVSQETASRPPCD